MYSRIAITGVLEPSPADQIKKKPLAKNFWGQVLRVLRTKTTSISLVSKATVSTIGEPISTPLLVIYEEEGSNGQTVNIEVIKSSMATPLMRIDAATKVALNFEFKSQSTTTSQGLKITLNVLKQATGFLAGGSQLFTTLSKDSVKEESRLMDSALNQLFAKSLSEKVLEDRGYIEADDVTVHLVLDDPKTSPLTIPIGKWTVGTTPPRPTIFSNTSIPSCAENKPAAGGQTIAEGQTIAGGQAINDVALTTLKSAYAGLTPEKVLGYQLTNQLKLGSYMKQQPWYTTALAELNNGDTELLALNKLCAKTPTELYKLGLNQYDSVAGLWALLKTAPINKNLMSKLDSAETCQDIKARLKKYGLPT